MDDPKPIDKNEGKLEYQIKYTVLRRISTATGDGPILLWEYQSLGTDEQRRRLYALSDLFFGHSEEGSHVIETSQDKKWEVGKITTDTGGIIALAEFKPKKRIPLFSHRCENTFLDDIGFCTMCGLIHPKSYTRTKRTPAEYDRWWRSNAIARAYEIRKSGKDKPTETARVHPLNIGYLEDR